MNVGIPINTDDSPPFVLELIYRLKVADVMTRDVKTTDRYASLKDVQHIMKANTITGVPILDGERLLGIVSMDDILQALDAGYIDEPAEEHMTRNVIVLEDDMPLSFAISYLDKYRYGRFPVLDKHKALVGILTSRDVIVALLLEINKEIEKLESQHKGPAPVDGELHREFQTRKFDFEHAGKPSTDIKKALKARGLPPKLTRRVAVAAYELEMNQVVHSEGGVIRCHLVGNRITIEAVDTGPGIPDVEKALTEGFSTATEWIRSLGFGAGMGLPNVRRVSDELNVDSRAGGPTTVTCHIFIPPEESDE
mgnify:CR=1 FL=1